jgi:hypothetical protein
MYYNILQYISTSCILRQTTHNVMQRGVSYCVMLWPTDITLRNEDLFMRRKRYHTVYSYDIQQLQITDSSSDYRYDYCDISVNISQFTSLSTQ